MRKLGRKFYLQDANSLARALIGKVLVHEAASGIIIETEAYKADDKASHSYNNRRTQRTEIQFREGVYILDAGYDYSAKIKTSPRINVDYAEECKNYLWRYFINDENC